jgi:hypothetical protein
MSIRPLLLWYSFDDTSERIVLLGALIPARLHSWEMSDSVYFQFLNPRLVRPAFVLVMFAAWKTVGIFVRRFNFCSHPSEHTAEQS